MSRLPDLGHKWPNPSRWSIVAYYVGVVLVFAACVAFVVWVER